MDIRIQSYYIRHLGKDLKHIISTLQNDDPHYYLLAKCNFPVNFLCKPNWIVRLSFSICMTNLHSKDIQFVTCWEHFSVCCMLSILFTLLL